jgi:release factor glutamine methyltransferase
VTIKQNLEYAIKMLNENDIEDARIKARTLLSYVLGKPKEYIIINLEQELEQENIFKKHIKELIEGKPLQYITQTQEFFGMQFYVDENVLIPQPDTEILVEAVIEIAKKEEKKIILDLCTGSGCIAISLSENIENSDITATDINKTALEIAKKNDKNKKIIFKQSDMFENLESEKFDIIVSNPPYIKTKVIESLEKDVQQEPKLALDGGEDGLKFYRAITENAYKYLNECGYLCLEIGEDQKEEVMELLKSNNYQDIYCKKDLSGNDRVIIAKYR